MARQQTKELYSSNYSSDNTCVVKWHKPPEYWLKINTDGSKDAEGNSGIGGICRDHRGKLTMVFASSIGRTSSNKAKASAALARGIIRRIQDIVGQLNCAIRHCYREANQVADALAKWSIDNEELLIFSHRDLPISAVGPYRLDYI
ncbi:uncharacterized protein LOC142175077 [Nicotiana tabacum]|uniref:Uncharacterized protein LOC142175077 n=1 Tax=Nicotiana tabacum TaxID=4097 RepID=A0AC58TK35_TOBAC